MDIHSTIILFISIPSGIAAFLIFIFIKNKKIKWIIGLTPLILFLYLPVSIMHREFLRYTYDNEIIPGNYRIGSVKDSLEYKHKKISLHLTKNKTFNLLKNDTLINSGTWEFIFHYLPTIVLHENNKHRDIYYEIYSSRDIRVCCGTNALIIDSNGTKGGFLKKTE